MAEAQIAVQGGGLTLGRRARVSACQDARMLTVACAAYCVSASAIARHALVSIAHAHELGGILALTCLHTAQPACTLLFSDGVR